MILESLINLFLTIITFILNKLPTIPDVPSQISEAIYNFINFIFDNIGLLGVFVPLNLIKIVVPAWLLVESAVTIYSITMWVIKKIPFIDVK